MIIDYSQYSLWNFCPWAWYERYVNQRIRPWTGQRSDALCLGSIVHNFMDNFAKYGKFFVDDTVLKENNPTPDTYAMAELLVQGYVKHYPAELWPVELAEQPLRFPLNRNTCECGGGSNCPNHPNIDGLAKLDGYFYVPKDTEIQSGLPGFTLTLSHGWWAKEYKTKAFHRRRAEWIKEWQTKKQADFQILALHEHIYGSMQPKEPITIQGVLVCVLEKPHEYTPMRKCAGCKESYELMSFVPKAEGFACPVCGVVQELSPYIPKRPKVPEYFRITVTRTPEQLDISRMEITTVAQKMEDMLRSGMPGVTPNRDACVNNVHRSECEYLGPHTYGGSTSDGGYVQVDTHAYMGVNG